MRRALKLGERCPLHRRKDCCGRTAVAKVKVHSHKRLMSSGIWRIEDPTHPRGYREQCSPAVLRKRKARLVESQINPYCWLCGESFTDYNEIELEHKQPKGMNGARRDDHWENLALAHHKCNSAKGSRRILANEENSPSSHTPSDLSGPQVLGDSSGRESNSGLCLDGKSTGRDSSEG